MNKGRRSMKGRAYECDGYMGKVRKIGEFGRLGKREDWGRGKIGDVG